MRGVFKTISCFGGLVDVPLPAARYRKRKARPDEESSDTEEERAGTGKKKKSSDSSKGLRHLTRQVCEKVKSKRTTTYREVANELVKEAVAAGGGDEGSTGESKTVRRRVYDALNVLMAMGIIVRDKKEIRWIGLPNAREELESLAEDREQREKRVLAKREQLKELELQKKLYRNLAARNILLEQHLSEDPENPIQAGGVAEKITLPFLIIHTKAGTDIACEMTDDRTQYTFNFSKPFEIHQEIQIIKDLGLPDATVEDESLWVMSAAHHAAAASSSSSTQPHPTHHQQPTSPRPYFGDGHYTRSHAHK